MLTTCWAIAIILIVLFTWIFTILICYRNSVLNDEIKKLNSMDKEIDDRLKLEQLKLLKKLNKKLKDKEN